MSGRRGNSTKIYQQIAEQIMHYIRSGDLKPGDKLPALADMAHEFGVSRAAMREAFSALQGMGLVKMRHGEGTFVANLDLITEIVEPMNAALLIGLGEMEHLHEVRTVLELAAVSAAAHKRSQSQLEEISSAIWELEWGSFDAKELALADWRVHTAIATASGNPVLGNLMSTMSASMQSVTMLIESTYQHKDRLSWYWKIFDAIERQDSEQAESFLKEYLSAVWEAFRQTRR